MQPPESDLVEATRQVIAVLDALAIPYCLGGSLASSIHGIPRATNDGDLVIQPALRHCRPLADGLTPQFVVSLEAVVNAVHDEACFNAIHRKNLSKVDVFISKAGGWHQSQMLRRQLAPLGADEGDRIFVASAEDTILAKLDWYRLGGGVSDRQWGDVTGVMKVQASTLDRDYLHHWAAELKLTGLLERALEESGLA